MDAQKQESVTLASYVKTCGECGGYVASTLADFTQAKMVLVPCGHSATIVLVPNPKLGA